jgi:hypothetical protein
MNNKLKLFQIMVEAGLILINFWVNPNTSSISGGKNSVIKK